MRQDPGYDPRAAREFVASGYRKVAPGWHKWRGHFRIAGAAVTEALIDASQISTGMHVLDVACGPGESTFAVAPQVGQAGFVAGVDLVSEMLPRFSERDAAAAQNIRFAVADAEALPFSDFSFDRVLCRAAIMHFPNPAEALRETLRVLRPNGRAAFSTLGPAEETPGITATLGVVLRYLRSTPEPEPRPDMYRFGRPGVLCSALSSAGFRNVEQRIITAPCPWPGTAVEFWKALPDHAWHVSELLERIPPEFYNQAASEAIECLREYEKDNVVQLTAPVVIASGVR